MSEKSDLLKRLVTMASRLILTAGLMAVLPLTALAGPKLIIGSGPQGSVDFSVSKEVCTSFAQHADGYRCRAARSSGSVENLHGLRRDKYDIVIARSDEVRDSLLGFRQYKNVGPDTELRSLFSVHSMALNIFVKEDAPIKRFTDLNGKSVAIGGLAVPLMRDLLRNRDWNFSGFSNLPHGGTKKLGDLLCIGRIDAVALAVTFPSGWMKDFSESCPIRLISFSDHRIDAMTKNHSYISKSLIPRNAYLTQDTHTQTIAYKMAFLTDTQLPEEDAYAFVKFTFENLDNLKQQHPLLSGLTPSAMIRDSLPAPLHPGAERYYREQGWIR